MNKWIDPSVRYVFAFLILQICISRAATSTACSDWLKHKDSPTFKVSKAELVAELKKVREAPRFSGSGRSSYLSRYLKKVAEDPKFSCPQKATKESLKNLGIQMRYSCCEVKGICDVNSSLDLNKINQQAYQAYLEEYYSGLMSLFGHSLQVKRLDVLHPHLKDPNFLKVIAGDFKQIEQAPDFDTITLDVDKNYFMEFDDLSQTKRSGIVLMKEGKPQAILESIRHPYPLTRFSYSSIVSNVTPDCTAHTKMFLFNEKSREGNLVLNQQTCERLAPVLETIMRSPHIKNCYFKAIEEWMDKSLFGKIYDKSDSTIIDKFGVLPREYEFRHDGIFRRLVGVQGDRFTTLCVFKEKQNPEAMKKQMERFFGDLKAFHVSHPQLSRIVTVEEAEGLKHIVETKACESFINPPRFQLSNPKVPNAKKE
jgi:hypothetical protein